MTQLCGTISFSNENNTTQETVICGCATKLSLDECTNCESLWIRCLLKCTCNTFICFYFALYMVIFLTAHTHKYMLSLAMMAVQYLILISVKYGLINPNKYGMLVKGVQLWDS